MAHVVLVAGLGFGDEGKGTVTDALTRWHEAHTVVRHSGGAQAAHNVVDESGRHHTFAQFGSGTLAGARTYLSRFMLVNPGALLNEAKHLAEIGVSDPHSLVYVDERALVTTPFHVAANRIRELHRGAKRHGSCGMGIGETVADARRGVELRVGELRNGALLREKLRWIRAEKLAELELDGIPMTDSAPWRALGDSLLIEAAAATCERFVEAVHIVDVTWLGAAMKKGTTVFEGAQGVLLDERWGFHPYTTWSNTTLENADTVLTEAGFCGSVRRVGVTRSFVTRHGPGPFPSEMPALSSADPAFVDAHNQFNEWQRGLRSGALDYVLIDYALRVLGGVNEVAMTHVDVAAPAPCYAHELAGGARRLTIPIESWSREQDQLAWQARVAGELAESKPVVLATSPKDPARLFEDVTGIPVTITSHGPGSHQKRRRP